MPFAAGGVLLDVIVAPLSFDCLVAGAFKGAPLGSSAGDVVRETATRSPPSRCLLLLVVSTPPPPRGFAFFE